jgi:hypothetical protein
MYSILILRSKKIFDDRNFMSRVPLAVKPMLNSFSVNMWFRTITFTPLVMTILPMP